MQDGELGMSNLQIESYKCDYCGSVFRHHQSIEVEVIKCPSCGATKVKIVENTEIASLSNSVQVKISSSTITRISSNSFFGINLTTLSIITVISIIVGVGFNWTFIQSNFGNTSLVDVGMIVFPLLLLIFFAIFWSLFRDYT